MQTKSLNSLICILALCAFFASCTKDIPATGTNPSQVSANDRADCDVYVEVLSATGSIDVCGTNTAFNMCNTVNGQVLFGTQTINGGGNSNYVVSTGGAPDEAYLVLSNNSPQDLVDVMVKTSGNVMFYTIINGTPQVVTIDNTCTIQ